MSDDAVDIEERWRRARVVIDRAIDEAVSKLPEANAVEAARYIARGGKRLRGFIVVELAEELGGSMSDAIDGAVAVELVHASSLALDDIIDEDITRRGMEAAWIRYGLKKTVMVSNLLIPYAQRIVDQAYGEEALRRTVKAWLDISRGEVLDAFADPQRLTSNTYLEMIKLKTGALFRLAAELGVIAARRLDLLQAASKLGELLGVMYQIADDIRDSRDPEKLSKEPSLRLFRRWAPSEEKALDYIRSLAEKAAELTARLVGGSSYSFHRLPLFIVRAMLGPVV